MAFTNGTLIDEKFAAEVARVGNFAPAISIEGFEEMTDFRRGKGTYNKVIRAMDIMRSHGNLFGFSATAITGITLRLWVRISLST